MEISPEQLSTASAYAEELTKRLNCPMNILGWYHSHPHITVWPSHVGEIAITKLYNYIQKNLTNNM